MAQKNTRKPGGDANRSANRSPLAKSINSSVAVAARAGNYLQLIATRVLSARHPVPIINVDIQRQEDQ
jgi:hypothetical protein